ETALLGLPQIVVYHTSWVTYWVGKILIKVKYISLVNLILGKEAVRELIQKDFNPQSLKEELRFILKGGSKRLIIEKDYKVLREKVGGPGASEKTGRMMVNYLKQEATHSESSK
ncbi:MAG: lipid-A-disaccharide synthase, partial [Bacteroidota bacterium]